MIWALSTRLHRLAALVGILGLGLAAYPAAADGPVKVKVDYEKDEIEEGGGGPIDPAQRIRFQQLGQTFNLLLLTENNQRLHLNNFPTLKVDGNAYIPGQGFPGSAWEQVNGKLPPKAGKERIGFVKTWSKDDIRITQTVELTPSKNLVDGKRRLDSALVRYTIENKGTVPHTVGLRTCIDSYLINQRNCKFAAPTKPGKLLEGMELKGTDVPPYLQTLQMPDLKNPGVVAHLTWALGSGLERPDRVVLTNQQGRRDPWELNVMAGGFSSVVGFYWEPKELKPKAKRELAYAYGTGLAAPVGADTNFKILFGGSFEKGKLFTISALVADPSEGQSLELDLPKGIEPVEGRRLQPIPPAEGDSGSSLVLWKARVNDYGLYPIRIRSSGGVSKTAKLTISPG